MNTKEAAYKWGISTRQVTDRCKEGMIPLAVKDRTWVIPNDAVKPILTRNQAFTHFQYLDSIHDGADPKISQDGFIFLADAGFITKLNDDGSTLRRLLHEVKVTTIGKELINQENIARRKNGKPEITIKAAFNVGILEAGIEMKM